VKDIFGKINSKAKKAKDKVFKISPMPQVIPKICQMIDGQIQMELVNNKTTKVKA